MMLMKCISLFLVFIIVLGVKPMMVHGWETDQTSSVTGVVDGDTFCIPGYRVRLADIDAPESGNEPGYSIAKYALANMIGGQTVYLDTDQKTGRDEYGRLIAVVYVKANSTHYLNVNKALLVQGVAVETDYTNNEFTPSTWTLYVKYAEALEPTTLMALISLAQNSVLTWLAVGLGTFIGIFGIINLDKDFPKNRREALLQVAIFVCVLSLGMSIVHMGDIYTYRNKLPVEYLPPSSNNSVFQVLDGILKNVNANYCYIFLICGVSYLLLQYLLNTNLFKSITRRARLRKPSPSL
jgi:hypothetical protein